MTCTFCEAGDCVAERCDPDPFAGPTLKPAESVKVKPGSNGEWVYMTGNGRYSAPDPLTGERRTWQRVTNAVKPLDDTYMLDRFGERHVALGMAQRPALCARAAALTSGAEHRDELQEIADRAKDHAGASDGADRGTVMHTWTARHDRGESLPEASSEVLDDIDTYYRALQKAHLFVQREYVERTCVIPGWGVMGTFDRLLSSYGVTPPCDVCPKGVLHVGDLKTGVHEITYGQVKAAQQFALYAHGTHLVNATRDGWEPAPLICPHVGIMMHLLIGSGECTLHRVDMVEGLVLAALSRMVTDARKTKGLVTPL